MIYVFCGHRGVGKTTFLSGLKEYLKSPSDFFDLDQEIEKKMGQSIPEIFAEKGEEFFRRQEKEIFTQICRANKDNLKNVKISQNLAVGFGGGICYRDCILEGG